MQASFHDAYAAGYDHQVRAYDCYLAEALFGLCYEYTRPGQNLLDLGIGSGLAAQLFAKAGLQVHGIDFSPAMLEICRAKAITVGLKQGDVQEIPWPYSSQFFEHLVCCGVLHFIGDLEPVFHEARRVLHPGGIFAFTTKIPAAGAEEYETQSSGGIDVFSHAPQYVEGLLQQAGFVRLKVLKAFVGQDLFCLWLAQARTAG